MALKKALVIFGVVLAEVLVGQAKAQSSSVKPKPSKNVSTSSSFRCNGRFGSFACEHTLFFNDCKNSIRIKWEPLQIPGNNDYKNRKRTWCSVTWSAVESTEERKFVPQACDRFMALLTSAIKTFPEIKWQDTACTHLSTPDGVIYTTERWVKPRSGVTARDVLRVVRPPGELDPEPVAVGLRDVRSCSLHIPVLRRGAIGANHQTPVDPKKVEAVTPRNLRCPVLPANVFGWLKSFLESVDTKLVIQNELE